ncbi:MAG: SHOCT domain-containing protein [Thermoplasmatales archaeon]
MRNVMKVFWVFVGLIVFLVVLSVVLSAAFVVRSAAGPYYGRYWMIGPLWGYGGILWMSLMMIVPFVLLVLFVIWIVDIATGRNEGSSESKEKSAIDILDERLANGSITREEYEKIKEALNKK